MAANVSARGNPSRTIQYDMDRTSLNAGPPLRTNAVEKTRIIRSYLREVGALCGNRRMYTPSLHTASRCDNESRPRSSRRVAAIDSRIQRRLLIGFASNWVAKLLSLIHISEPTRQAE